MKQILKILICDYFTMPDECFEQLNPYKRIDWAKVVSEHMKKDTPLCVAPCERRDSFIETFIKPYLGEDCFLREGAFNVVHKAKWLDEDILYILINGMIKDELTISSERFIEQDKPRQIDIKVDLGKLEENGSTKRPKYNLTDEDKKLLMENAEIILDIFKTDIERAIKSFEDKVQKAFQNDED
jgi:hypothetical protein